MSQDNKRQRINVRPSRPRRPSATRARPTSGMPQGPAQTHSLFMEIANLQMTRARQLKIRDALLAQIANCEDEIDRADVRIASLRAQVERIETESGDYERATDPVRRGVPRAPSRAATEDDATRSNLTVEELRSGAFTFKY